MGPDEFFNVEVLLVSQRLIILDARLDNKHLRDVNTSSRASTRVYAT